MQVHPSRASFRELTGQGNLIPVWTELLADTETPVGAYAKLRRSGPSFLLESIEGGERLSRYSFLGCRPRKVFVCRGGETQVIHLDGTVLRRPTPRDPLALIEEEMRPFRPVQLPGQPPFVGGAVGCLAYEYVHHVEEVVPKAAGDPLGLPVLYFMMADTLATFDRARQTLRLSTLAPVADPAEADSAYDAAVARLRALEGVLADPLPQPPARLTEPGAPGVPPGNFTRERFEAMVERSKDYIRAGDIIQVVLSQRFERPFSRSPLDLYRALRTVNPSPYMFLLETPDFAAIGASPEVHVRLTGELVEIRPIAGTRRRGATPEEDGALERELLADEKERAEHLMLVDLARNDIGRVCVHGTVRVEEFMVVERYSHVMHIVSQVEGRIARGRTAFDLMRATFPAGTVSGAPKIRAMQIIAEAEGQQRGLYSGAVAYFSYDGNLDSCIALRTAVQRGGTLYIQAGAGIVADSRPDLEYEETVNKARSLLKAALVAENLAPHVGAG